MDKDDFPNASISGKLLSGSSQSSTDTMQMSPIVDGGWVVDDSSSSTLPAIDSSRHIDSRKTPTDISAVDPAEIHRIEQIETPHILVVDQVPSCSVISDNTLPLPPNRWPQAPIMLRPTPRTQMITRGVRYSNSTMYQSFPGLSDGMLPINTGYELPGQSLVIDFESPLFIGTLLVRVKGAVPVKIDPNSTHDTDPYSATNTSIPAEKASASYFDGKKRRFQVVVKGRFKAENVPLSGCVTGQIFDRPAGKLPARYIVNSIIKCITTLAPQLEVELDSHRPRFLSPLVSTAHTVIVKDCSTLSVKDSSVSQKIFNLSINAGSATMEDDMEEPPSQDSSSVMRMVQSSMKSANAGRTATVIQRRANRKKAFNRFAATRDNTHVFDTSKEYTFEFYQHLLLLSEPDAFKINMGHNMQIGLTKALNGQPIKILAARRRERSLTNDHANESLSDVLWSFDLWHQSLHSVATADSK